MMLSSRLGNPFEHRAFLGARLALGLIFAVAISIMLRPGVAEARAISQYILGSGDVIKIQVFGEEDLSFDEVRLTDAGTLSYPFLGELQAKGITTAHLEKLITNGLLGDYLIDPRVTVSIVEYRDFFVNGEVNNPGGYPYVPGLTVQKAITLAGGLTERASRSSMTVVRELSADGGAQKVLMGTVLMPGDILSIPQSFLPDPLIHFR